MSVLLRKKKAIFLDRDGVLNEVIKKHGKPYPPQNLKELKILKGVLEGLKILKSKGFLLIVITNQPDVSRGITTKNNVQSINDYLMEKLPLDEINTCFHDDNDNCNCRKPKPGMIINSAKKMNISLTNSYLIGDRKKDIDAGINAGCKTIFIDYDYNEIKPKKYDLKVESLWMASRLI